MSENVVSVKRKAAAKAKKHKPQPLLEVGRNYSVSAGAAAAGVAAITFWRAIYAGHLQTYRAGRRRVVSGQQIQDWLDAGGKTGQVKGGDELCLN